MRGTLKDTLTKVQPTIFFGVPRVWEKIAEGMKAVREKTPKPVLAVTDWAKSHCFERVVNCQLGKSGEASTAYGMIAGPLVKVLKGRVGLTNCRYHFTGAAPITKETLEYFGQLDIAILELYGMSENCGPQSVSLPHQFKWGACGGSLPGCEVWIDHQGGTREADGSIQPAEDREGRLRNDPDGEGEICFRGRHI